MVLQAGEGRDAGVPQFLDVRFVHIEARIAVELAVQSVAGIAFLRGPDLLARFVIAREGGRPAGRADRTMHAVLRARVGVQQAVGIEDEILDAEFVEDAVDARFVAALGQPDAAWPSPEDAGVRAHRHGDLGVQALFVRREQREVAMGGAASEDLEVTRLREPAKRLCHVLAVLLHEAAPQTREQVAVELHHRMEIGVARGAPALARERLEPLVEIAHIAVLQQRIGHHRKQRRCERQGDAKVHAVARQALEDIEQRKVGFGQGLEEPVLFEEVFVLRVAHEREVCVQYEREVAFGFQGRKIVRSSDLYDGSTRRRKDAEKEDCSGNRTRMRAQSELSESICVHLRFQRSCFLRASASLR